jgi:hypothetical protein
MRKFIVIEDYKEDGMFYIGTFETYHMALGRLMNDVFDLRDVFTHDDDFFEIGKLAYMAGDGGTRIDVRFRRGESGKMCTQSYLILFDDGEGKRPEKDSDLLTAEEAFKRAKMRIDECTIEAINGCIDRGETFLRISSPISDTLRERLSGMGYAVVDNRSSSGVRIDWGEG